MPEKSQETPKKKGGFSTAVKTVIGIIVIIIIILAIAFLTLNITVMPATPGVPLSFTTNYGVSFPEGQPITIGNTHISVLSYQNELISDIDGDKEKLVYGEDRNISERRAVITTLGVVTLIDTHFQILLKYKGERDNRAYFDMAVQTSQQVPDILLRNLLPSAIDARPI